MKQKAEKLLQLVPIKISTVSDRRTAANEAREIKIPSMGCKRTETLMGELLW